MMIETTAIEPASTSTSEVTPAQGRLAGHRPAGYLRPRHLDFGMPALERRLNALLLRHARLERQLRQAVRGPFKDGFAIQRLKRLKLLVKDEVATLKSVLRAERVPGLPPYSPRGSSRRGLA